jgi:predicted DNA-binding protein with PD1-like motif
MTVLPALVPMRLSPGQDLRLALQQWLAEQQLQAAWVVSGIGSLSLAPLRLAGQEGFMTLAGDLEILTLSGSLSLDGAHLHISVATTSGQVSGGHLGLGSQVRTTAELLVAPLPAWCLRREPDPDTGHLELVIRRHDRGGCR